MTESDEGISATSTKKREGFKTMIADAKAGKIDLIITKSVSRFARNTVDSLTTVRELKDRGIEIYFEKENIWTLDSKGELLITIMSSLAQEESRSISENVTWGQRKRFADGKVSFAYSRVLGLDKGPDGRIVVNPREAETVRLIFSLFLEGLSPHSIAAELTRRGIKTPGGKDVWNQQTVRRMLSNEKYKGDALLQKEFTVDFLNKKTKKNEGEVPQYYVENNHDAIIDPAVFEAVQKQMAVRQTGTNRQSSTGLFSSKIKCGDCGSWYGSKVWHSNDKYRRIIWQCNHKFDGGEKCSTPHLDEETIKGLFIKAVNILTTEKDEIAANFQAIKGQLFSTGELETEQSQLQEELNVVAELIQQCVRENAHVVLDQTEYQARYDGLAERFDRTKARLDEVRNAITEKQAKKEQIERFLAELERQDGVATEFDEEQWYSLVDFVTVFNKEDIRFTFKDGTEIKV